MQEQMKAARRDVDIFQVMEARVRAGADLRRRLAGGRARRHATATGGGLRVTTIEEALKPCSGTSEEAQLGIAAGTAVFRSHRIVRDCAGQVIELSEDLIRSDTHRFTMHQISGERE
jgi:hypothetical protein